MTAISHLQRIADLLQSCGCVDPQGEVVARKVEPVFEQIQEAKQLEEIVKITQEVFSQLLTLRGMPKDPKSLHGRSEWIRHLNNHFHYGIALERTFERRDLPHAQEISSTGLMMDELQGLALQIKGILKQLYAQMLQAHG